MNVHLYVLDTLSDWEPGYVTAEVNSGRFFAKPGHRLPVRTVGASRRPITTMGGIGITPDLAVDELDPAGSALLLLIGADNWLEPEQRPVLDKARQFLAAGVPVAAICGATIGLAASGLLDDRPHVSNNFEALKQLVPNYRGEAHYQHGEVAVTDGDLITATGMAPLDLAHHVLRRLDVFSPDALDAWYQLNHTRDPQYFFALMNALPQPVTS